MAKICFIETGILLYSSLPAMQFHSCNTVHIFHIQPSVENAKTVEHVSNYVVDQSVVPQSQACHDSQQACSIFFRSQWARASSLSRLHDHTHTHTHSRQDSSGRVISPTQKPLPYNTQHSQETHIRALGGIRTCNPSMRAATDPHLRRRGHWYRPACSSTNVKPSMPLMNTVCMRAIGFYFQKDRECSIENIRKLLKLNYCHDFFHR